MPIPETPPRTDDERWRTLLERMGVPGYPGVYILGAFARHVTFYSQQVRALNLVDALCSTGRVAQGSSVAVVGAGLAGLTAAAAAVRRGLHVQLVEEKADPGETPGQMPLQINSNDRWIDPFIYDWPDADPDEPDAEPWTHLPVLPWKAQNAHDVRDQVLKQFADLIAEATEARGKPPISFHRRLLTGADLTPAGDGQWRVRVAEDGHEVKADAVILAVGFGVEQEPETRFRYWTGDGLGGDQAEKKTYLVTGAGDGGLTDVMRLCIAEFRHRRVLGAFRDATSEGSTLRDEVRAPGTDLARAFLREAGNFDSTEIRNALKERDTRVFLTGSPSRVFGEQAGGSILNRLIVAWLLRNGRFALVDAAYAKREEEGKGEEGRFRVHFSTWDGEPCDRPRVWAFRDGELRATDEPLPERFDDVVVRHGPGLPEPAARRRRRPIEVHYPTLWSASSDNEAWWRKLPHWDDWTRKPAWAADAFTQPPPLDLPLRGGPLYLVVEQKAVTDTKVYGMVTAMLRKANLRDSADSAISLDPVQAFSTPQQLGRAVRALCRADVVVFDVTPSPPDAVSAGGAAVAGDGGAGGMQAQPQEKLSPEMMVLLGIRSVARRSLTLVTSRFRGSGNQEPALHDAPFRVPLLPFLLRDVSVYGWWHQDSFMDRLKQAIDAGRERAERLGPIYRDLPAYEEVRRLGPDPAHFREHAPNDQVLFLTPFDEDYRYPQGDWLMARVGVIAPTARRMNIVQSASPERTPAKLYAAIRRTQFCVVDWTRRSPNVFYELGVRLAATPRPPVSVLHRSDPWACGIPKGMFALFHPLVYEHEDSAGEQAFEKRLEARKDALKEARGAAGSAPDGALVSPDFVYRQMESAVAPGTEDWSVPVWKELETASDQIIGRDPTRDQEFRGIFGDNEALKRRAMESARDRLVAAWFYLDQVHELSLKVGQKDSVLSLNTSPWREWMDIGLRLEVELGEDARPESRRIRERIKEILRLVETLSTDDHS